MINIGKHWKFAVGAILVSVISFGFGLRIGMLDTREQVVRQMGSKVMPFDLSKTLHTFTKMELGGLQSVAVRNSADLAQRDLIRGHLRSEVEKFSKGDFGDPSATHGKDLPGVAVIRDNSNNIKFEYEELPDGARIVYTTSDPKLVRALYDWFDAQVSDHGSDAMHGQ